MMPDPTPADDIVPNSAFMQTMAGGAPKGSSLWVTAFAGTPDLTDAKNWAGKPYSVALNAREVDAWSSLNSYFSVAALMPSADGELRRRKANFCRLLVLVADDVHLEDVHGQVSYVLTTSPGKTQVGIFIDGADPDGADKALVGKVVTTMADKGMMRADPSGNNAVRYVRLPVGQNQKPRESGAWQHHLERWSPNVVMSLADAAAAFGVDLDELRKSTPAGDDYSRPNGPQDERLRALTANVLRGEYLHDSINSIAASLVASRMPGGAIVNHLRALMDASHAAKDERWLARYQDIPRSVSTAEEKFKRPPMADEAPADGALPLVFAEDVSIDQVGLTQIVEDTLTAGGLSVMYGESNSGKSFMACDMDCSIASGSSWLGKRTVQGAVLYVAGEGSESIKMRVLAWKQHHGVNPMLAVVPVAVNLLNPAADVTKVIEAAATVSAHYGMPVTKITIDTLARAFGGGNENASEDMGAVIANADRIRAATKAHVMAVHHAGKDASKGSRGHSSLKAATDTEIEVTAEESTKLHTARITKQRDLGSRGEEMTAKFSVVEMGKDQWGKAVTTCVVDGTELKPASKSTRKRGAELREAIRDILLDLPNRTMKRGELVKRMKDAGFTSSPIYRAIGDMAQDNEIKESMNLIHLERTA